MRLLCLNESAVSPLSGPTRWGGGAAGPARVPLSCRHDFDSRGGRPPPAFNLLFVRLQKTFEYPNVLRKPTDHVLRRCRDRGPPLRRLWYAFAFTAVLFTPVPVLVHLSFAPRAPELLAVGTTFGVLAGLVQFLGLIRWSFLVPTLADLYHAPDSSDGTRDSVVVTFEAFNRYAGVAVGEHAGYLFTAAWTLSVCAAAIVTGAIPPIIGWVGIPPAIGVLLGVFEETGLKAAAAINAVAYVLWSLWLIALGVALLARG